MVHPRIALIEAHTREIRAREAIIATLQEEYTALQAEYLQAVTTRDRLIAELDATRAAAVTGLQEEINRRDRLLGEFNHRLIDMQGSLARAQEEINRRDRMLADLQEDSREAVRVRDGIIDHLRRRPLRNLARWLVSRLTR